MKKAMILAAAAAAALTALSAQAQQTNNAGNGFRMPYQSGWWGYAGISGGISEYRNCPIGSCDKRDDAWKVYGGGNFNQTFGGEISYVDLGSLIYSGGSADANGINLSLTAGFPLGRASSLFAKVGSIYSRTRASGFAAGTERDWGLSYGVGATLGFTDHWQGRIDWDRYRVSYVGRDSDVDALTVGVQYRF